LTPSPILVLAFNRPRALGVLLQRLQTAGDRRVYFAVDGPRANRPDDAPLVAESHRLIRDSGLAGPERCLFRDANVGLRRGVSGAISWFFEREPEGIILEDDCIPGDDFFPFFDWALDRFRLDHRVKMISGFNRFPEPHRAESFFYIRTPLVWGWAAWRRTWNEYDAEFADWDDPAALRRLRAWCGSRPAFDHWVSQARIIREGKLSSWAKALGWSVQREQGLVVLPKVSLIQNIGFGDDATNTRGGGGPAPAGSREAVRSAPLPSPYVEPRRTAVDRTWQRRLDRAEFWLDENTVWGRARDTLRLWKRKLHGR